MCRQAYETKTATDAEAQWWAGSRRSSSMKYVESRSGITHPTSGYIPKEGPILEGTLKIDAMIRAFMQELDRTTCSHAIAGTQSSAMAALFIVTELERIGQQMPVCDAEYCQIIIQDIVDQLNTYGPP